MMKPSQVLIKIYANLLTDGWENSRYWSGPKVFEERLVSPDQAEALKDEWIRLSKFFKKDDLCEKCWEKVAPNLCKGCKKYNHICCLCLESINACSECDSRQYEIGDEMTVLSDVDDNVCDFICSSVFFNAMKLEVIVDTKIIEAFKIVHPKGYVRSYPIFDAIMPRNNTLPF